MASNDTTPANIQSSETDQPYRGERSADPMQGREGQGGEDTGGRESEGQGGDANQNDNAAADRAQRDEGYSARLAEEKQREDRSRDAWSNFWPMYLKESEKEDNNLVDNITIYTNGVLVFTGLFGAIVTAFIIESYKQLQPPDSGTTAAVALFAHLSLQIAASSNGTHLPSITLDSSAFRPSSSALRVNILWFLSLSLSLSCALGAALMQQWARRYISHTKEAQRAGTVDTQGLIHAYLFLGLRTFRFKAAVEALPALLHASVILFFVGMVDFLVSINKTVAYVLLAFVALGALVYLGLTILPSTWPNSPYATPLSPVMDYIVFFVGLTFSAIILVPEGAFDPTLRRRFQLWRLYNSSFLTTIPRAAALVPGEIVRIAMSILRAIAVMLGKVVQFMKTRLSADGLQNAAWSLRFRRINIIKHCRSLLTASTREILHDAARSHDTVGIDTLMWTLVTVMDDALELGKCYHCIHLFLQRKDLEKAFIASLVDDGKTPLSKLRLTLMIRRTEHEITEIRSQLGTDGILRSFPSVLHDIAVSLKSADKVDAAALRERAKSCLDLMCMLANGGVKPYYASGMAEALSELRQDADTDLAVNATCTNALFHFHAQSWGFLDGPAADTPPDEADLKDVETIWATNVVHDLRGDVDGAIAFVSFTQSVLPRLRSASPETVELVWKTIGYDLDTSGESASNPRSRSWGSSGSFPVGGNSNMKWARRSSWDIEQRRGNGQSFWDPKDRRDIAKLLSSLRRLRTTILAAGFPDPLDADHSIDSLPYPPEMYVKLYNNLRQLYRFLTEFEDLVRASASSAPIESVAGPSTSPPEMTVHPAEPEPANTPHGLDPQRRLAHDEPDVSADEREPAPEIGGDPGA